MDKFKKGGNKFNSNITATNRLFAKNPLLKKRRKKAPGIYDPNAKYRFPDGGIVQLDRVPGSRFKKDASGTWVYESGAPVTDEFILQELNYGKGKPIGSPVVQGAPKVELKPYVTSGERIQKINDLQNSVKIADQQEANRLSQVQHHIDLYNPEVFEAERIKPKGLSDLQNWEWNMNEALDFPMERAHTTAAAATEDPGEEVDNLRHSLAGEKVEKGIANATGNIPYLSPAMGFIGSNLLGAGHEAMTLLNPDKRDNRSFLTRLQESGEDLYNNYVGAKVGASDMTPEEKTNYLLYLSGTNRLPDGIVMEGKPKKGFSKNVYFKHSPTDPGKYKSSYAAGGALLTKKVTCKKCGWKWDAADGGNDITTCHKCGGQGLVHAAKGGESGCPEGYAFNPVTGECIEWNPTVWNSEEEPTSYDPVGDIVYMNPNDRPEGMSDEEYAQMYQDQIEHEQLHRLQWINGELKGESKTPLRMPSTVDNQQYDGEHYYNRRGEEEKYVHDIWNQRNPELAKFLPEDLVYNKEVNPLMYNIPWTEEGEARGYEGAVHNGMESIFPKKTEGGEYIELDLTTKEIDDYKKGGFIVEDISVPSLNQMEEGGRPCPKGQYRVDGRCVQMNDLVNRKLKPYITNDPNDPRIKLFGDSLHLYNQTLANHKSLQGRRMINQFYNVPTSEFQEKLYKKAKIKPVGFMKGSRTSRTPAGIKASEYPVYPMPRQEVIYKPKTKQSKKLINKKTEEKPIIKQEIIEQQQLPVQDNYPPPPPIATLFPPEYYGVEPNIQGNEVPMYATPDSGAEFVPQTERYIDWDGNSIGFNGVRFRKPGHGGDLIRKGRRHYLHYPSIETRHSADIVPEEEFAMGGEYNVGDEVELTEAEVKRLRSLGYIIEEA